MCSIYLRGGILNEETWRDCWTRVHPGVYYREWKTEILAIQR